MRHQLFGVIHVYVVPGNEERKHPEVLFPQLFKSCLTVVSQITSIYALFKKDLRNVRNSGLFREITSKSTRVPEKNPSNSRIPFSNTQWSSVFSIHSYLHGAGEEPKEAPSVHFPMPCAMYPRSGSAKYPYLSCIETALQSLRNPKASYHREFKGQTIGRRAGIRPMPSTVFQLEFCIGTRAYS